jgi:hypothetical protein
MLRLPGRPNFQTVLIWAQDELDFAFFRRGRHAILCQTHR